MSRIDVIEKEVNIRCLVETEVDHGDVDRRPTREKAPGPADRLTRIPNPNAGPAMLVVVLMAAAVVVAVAGAKAGADNT